MKLLLGTRALLWWLSDDNRIGPQARALIADPGNHFLVSVVSLREIVVKVRVGKLEAEMDRTRRSPRTPLPSNRPIGMPPDIRCGR